MILLQIINQIFETRKLSYQKIAALFGYSSPTSIFRLLNGNTSMDLLYDFANKIPKTISLSPQEKKELMAALNDQSDDGWCEQFWNILTKPFPETEASSDWQITNMTDGSECSFSEIVKEGRDVQITLINWTYPEFSHYLGELARQYEIQVNSYYQQPKTVIDVLHIMDSIFEILGLPWFKVNILLPTNNETIAGMYPAKAMIFNRMLENRKECFILVPYGVRSVYCTPFPENYKVDPKQLFITGSIEKQPLSEAEKAENYIDYLNYCYGLEKNHSIYQIKPVFGLGQIPIAILDAASERGPFRNEPYFSQMKSEMVELQSKRWDNLHHMRQFQYRFYQKEGFLRFAKTGRTNDQFWGLDALTPEERRITLTEILKQMDENGRYSLQLFHEGTQLKYNEITEYRGKGLSLMLPPTHYRIDQENTEFFYRSDVFEKFLCHSFKAWLEKEKLMSHEESRKAIVEALNSIEG